MKSLKTLALRLQMEQLHRMAVVISGASNVNVTARQWHAPWYFGIEEFPVVGYVIVTVNRTALHTMMY